MRTFSALIALSAFTATAFAKKVSYNGNGYVDGGADEPPTAGTKWSYWPNSGSTCSTPVVGCCGASGQSCSPENWIYFSQDTSDSCQYPSGGQQSPVDLDLIGEAGYKSLSKADGQLFLTKGGKCHGEIVSKSSTWEIEFADCEEEFTVTVDGEEWKLYQMHVHGPSEHAVNGMYYPMEVHLVHLPTEGPATRGLVLGLFLTPGKSNSILSIFDNEEADFTGEAFKAFNPYSLLPMDKSYAHYIGSLTTPGLGGANLGCQLNADGANGAFDPDNNNISWYVFKKPTTASLSQIGWFTDYFCDLNAAYLCQNNRPLQEIHTDIYSYGKALKW